MRGSYKQPANDKKSVRRNLFMCRKIVEEVYEMLNCITPVYMIVYLKGKSRHSSKMRWHVKVFVKSRVDL